MVTFYLSLVGLAAALMTIGLAVPAIIFATCAAGLALRSEIRWVRHNFPRIKPIRDIDSPAPAKG